MVRHMGTSLKHGGHAMHIIVVGEFPDQHQVEQSFGQRLVTIFDLGEFLLQFRYGVSAEANAFTGIQQGGFGDQAGDAAHALVDLGEGDLADLPDAVFLEDVLDLRTDNVCLGLEPRLEYFHVIGCVCSNRLGFEALKLEKQGVRNK